MSEYEAVVKAVDTIMSFLYTHEKSSTTSMWESDIDGTTLKTDWGYFEQGLNEIKWYCTELESNVMPSADRPQGEWVDMGDFEQCSVCKGTRLKEFQSYYGKVTWIKTPYCPSCGAKMKGADDEVLRKL